MKSLLRAASVIGTLAMVAGLARPADACVHAASAAKTQVSQKGQRLLVIHDGAQQTSVLRVEYDAGAPLADLAMVIPVPSPPTAYDTAAEDLFEALEDWAPIKRAEPRIRAKSKGVERAIASAEAPIELLPPAKAGPYAIQPIKARGAAGAKALAQWLADNGYTPIPEPALQYYAQREWAFLAVKTEAGKDDALDKVGALPPLSFTFASDRVVVPLKLEAQGVFPVRVYMVTTEARPDEDFAGAQAKGFEVASAPGMTYLRGENAPSQPLSTPVGAFESSAAPKAVGKVLASAAKGKTSLHLRVLFTESFGVGAADPSRWVEELAVPALVGDGGPAAKSAVAKAADGQAEPKGEVATPDAEATKAEAAEAAPAPAKAGPADAKASTPESADGSGRKGCRVAVSSNSGPISAALLLWGVVAVGRRRRPDR